MYSWKVLCAMVEAMMPVSMPYVKLVGGRGVLNVSRAIEVMASERGGWLALPCEADSQPDHDRSGGVATMACRRSCHAGPTYASMLVVCHRGTDEVRKKKYAVVTSALLKTSDTGS